MFLPESWGGHGSKLPLAKLGLQREETAMQITPLLGEGLVTRSVRVAKREVVFVKGLFEASEGLGALFAERGGDLVIAAPISRAAELDELLLDLVQEIGADVDWGLSASHA